MHAAVDAGKKGVGCAASRLNSLPKSIDTGYLEKETD